MEEGGAVCVFRLLFPIFVDTRRNENMYKCLYLISLFFLIACTKNSPVLSLQGRVPGTTYDGEMVYLVPFKGATSETVDSTYIIDGTFEFNKPVKQKEIAIIRTRPLLRLSLQELLVVIEPGQLSVELDKESSASGTTLNDALQLWKEKKTQSEEARILLKQMLQVADDSSKVELQARLDQQVKDFSTYNFEFVRENKDNIVGQFVYTMVEGGLTDQQKEILNIIK